MRQVSSRPWWLVALCAGCTTLAGIDDDYVAKKADFGGTGAEAGTAGSAGEGGSGALGGAAGSGGGSGAAGGSSGTEGSGGSAGSQGSAGSAGTGAGATSGTGGTGPSCSGTQKACDAECVTPGPENGCMSVSCDACPTSSVEHAFAVCLGGNCGLQCEDGYVPDAGRCVPPGAGGTGGSGGTGGTGGTGGSGGSSGSSGSAGSSGAGGSGGGVCHPATCPPCTAPDGRIPCCRNGICACGYPVICI